MTLRRWPWVPRQAVLALACSAAGWAAHAQNATTPSPPAPAASALPVSPPAASTDAPVRNPADPLEGFNRNMFAFNDAIDEAVLKPVATAYRDVVPGFVRTSIDNFFNNITDVWSAANHLAQGKLETGLRMTMRVGTNTVLGGAGLLDVATEVGLERESEDFGQTLGVWGFDSGPYLVLPLFGPSTVRDGLALPVDRMVSPSQVVDNGDARTGINLLQLVNGRANLLGATRMLDEIALDRYTFVRDAYLARRRNQVYDGNPPEDEEDAGQ